MTGRRLPAGMHGWRALRVGDQIETAQVIVTGETIDHFANLSGDHFALHMSDDAALAHGFAGRVAHGLLVLSLVDGLKNQAPAQLRAIASLGWNITFSAPVLVGDTLRATFALKSKRLTREAERGIAVFLVDVRNQRDEIVQTGQTTLMMQL